jgi:flagellar L-ring protein FlgH
MKTPYAWISRAITFLVLGCVVTLIGCAGDRLRSHQPRQMMQAYPSPPPPPPVDGSVYRDGAPLAMLFTDQKARVIGDLVTVNIVEVASASKEATTQTGHSSSVSAGVDAFFGLEKFIPPGVNPVKVAGSLGNNFDGSGKTVRSGKVTATVTAVVTQVLPNGNLVIEGSREVTVNNEQELIVLSGVVRPKDISPGNVVLSTALGNGQIAYYGSGIIAEKQRPGWLGRVVDTVWPF